MFDDNEAADTAADWGKLIALGVAPGSFTRGVSLNAFDKPDPEPNK